CRLLSMAVQQVEQLCLKSGARTIAIEIAEKRIFGIFEDEGCVEPRRQPLCQRGFACADRTFHGEVAELQGAPMISSRRDTFDDRGVLRARAVFAFDSIVPHSL